MKKFIIIFGVIILLGLIAGGIYYFLEKPSPSEQNPPENGTTHSPCLGENETAIFQYRGARITATSADVIISDKITDEEKFRFQVDNLIPNHGWPYEFRRCGIYIMKEFNWDEGRSKPLPGYREEIWRYNYNGEGEKFLTLVSSDELGRVNIFYSSDFRTDFLETYIALIAGSLERIEEYATIIKEISTKNDVFSLGYKNIIDRYPALIGFFRLSMWTKDGHYFWGRLHVGASVTAFFRIERDSWDIDTFLTPPHILGGTAFNPEFGYVTYDTGPGWIGIDIIAEQVYDEWRKAGKKVDFYLYNLFTKEKTLLATITDPAWDFKPKWLSDTELEYELPTGERKVFKIEEQ